MNPLLYKAHPLLWLSVDLIANPKAHSPSEAAHVALVYLAANVLWAVWLWRGLRKTDGFTPSIPLAYLLALPASVSYLAMMATLLADVLAHEFHFADRFILVFSVFIASQMLGGFYAVSIRHRVDGRMIGLVDGLAVSLYMWLFSLPVGLAVLWLGPMLKVF